MCGLQTRSRYPMCNRPGKCRYEVKRLGPTLDKSRRNEVVRRYRASRQRTSVPAVYAVWFPSAQVLKVGFTTYTNDSPFVAVARGKAKRRGWDIKDSRCIWKRPGDERTEAWMQVTLAFRWPAAFDQKHSRICEWFRMPVLTEAEISAVLDEIYARVPDDLAGRGAAVVPEGAQPEMF